MTADADGAREEKHGSWQPKSNKWLIAILVTLAAFMEILDTTIVVVSLPHIAGALSVSYDDATWSLTSYLIANGIVLTISGWLARMFGRKRYFLICIAMFSVSSLLCGLSTNLTELILARLAQGFFGGGLQPTQQAIVLDSFEPSQRNLAFGITTIATVVAPVIGPALGGWITDNYSWPWVFFINVPIGVLTSFGVMHLVEDPPWARSQKSWDVDYIGIGLIALGLGSLQIVMDRGEDEDWFGSNLILTFATLAALGILGAIAWLLYAKKPVINIRVFADRNFAISAGLMATMAVILYASVNLIPELAQQQLGYDSTHAGMVLSPGAIVVIILIPIVARLESLVATKYLIATGFVILGTAMFYSRAALTPDASYGELVIMRMAQVSGLAFLFAPLTTTAYSNFSEAESGDATALFTMARNVSGSIGVSLATAMVVERTQVRMAHLAPHMTPLDQGYAASLHQYQQAILGLGGRAISGIEQTATGLIYQAFRSQAAILAYIDVFTLCGIAAFCAAPMALFLASHTGGGTHAE